MTVINMPGGAIEVVDPNQLLWMRKAFADERKNAVVLRIGGDRLYSLESLKELKRKWATAKVPLAIFTPPEGDLEMVVNAANVAEVEESDTDIYHKKARAVLVFSRTVRLAVREKKDEASAKLDEAKNAVAQSPRIAARAARS